MPIGAPGKPTLVEAGANDVLAGQECRAARGARLLAVILQEAKPSFPMRSMFGVS